VGPVVPAVEAIKAATTVRRAALQVSRRPAAVAVVNKTRTEETEDPAAAEETAYLPAASGSHYRDRMAVTAPAELQSAAAAVVVPVPSALMPSARPVEMVEPEQARALLQERPSRQLTAAAVVAVARHPEPEPMAAETEQTRERRDLERPVAAAVAAVQIQAHPEPVRRA
jgi:hypothetical protein